MIYIKDQFATVWEVEDKGNYSLVKMSTSRKHKETGEYLNSNWSFVRFVGDAHKKAGELERQTRIVIKGGGISWESYTDASGNRAWPKNPQLVVFNFGYPEPKEPTDGFDSAPVVEEESEEDLPF